MDEELFMTLCNTAAKKAIEMMTGGKKMRTEETAFCKAVVELAKSLTDIDAMRLRRGI